MTTTRLYGTLAVHNREYRPVMNATVTDEVIELFPHEIIETEHNIIVTQMKRRPNHGEEILT